MMRERERALGQSTMNALSTVNGFWATGLRFHFHSLFLVSECWAIGLGFHLLSLFSSFSFFFSFLMLTAAKKICINVFIIVNY
jgi:hypothetical protein